MLINEILISLGIDTKQAQQSLNKLENTFSELLKIGGSFAGLFSLSSLANSFIETNKRINNLSQSLGENYQDIQAWGNIVKSVGGDVASFENTLTTLNNGIQQIAVNGNSALLPVLNRLGVAVKNNNGEFRKGTEILKDLSATFSIMSNATSQAFGKMLGLDNGTINLLKQGSDNLNTLLERQQKLGLYTEKDGKLAIQFSNSLNELKQSLQSIMAVFVRSVLPVLQKFNEAMLNIALFVRKYENFIKVFFSTLSVIFAFRLAPAIFNTAKAFLSLKSSTAWLLILGGAIASLIDDFIIWKQGGDALFGSLYEWLTKNKWAIDTLKNSVIALIGAFSIAKIAQFGNSLTGMIAGADKAISASKLGLLLTMFSAGYKIGDFAIGKIKGSINKDIDNIGGKFKNGVSNEEIQALLNNPRRQKILEERAKNGNTSNNVSISKIEINTQATNSEEIASNINEAIQNNFLVNQNNGL